ncbi:hypothetical protein E2320_012573 [Naja naja]|nr:hypothetical protein E2320_012573 [Naja naja]
MDICITIQNAYEKQHPWLDLSSLGFCYLIYFNSMSQVNRQTQRKRRLRRRMDLAYPLIMGSIPKSQSWPVGTNSGHPCSCQQCLLVNSTRAASNAILASQRRKVYSGNSNGTLAVRQSNTFNGTALWSLGAVPAGGMSKMEQSRSANGVQAATAFSRSQSAPNNTQVPGQNNLNRPGTQRAAILRMTGILMCAAGLPVCLTRAPKPILHPPPVNKSDMKAVPGITGICRKTKKKHLKKSRNPEDMVRRYIQKVKNPPDEDCTICMERLVSSSGYEGILRHKGAKPELVGKLGKCGHMYHLLCLVAMYNNGNKQGIEHPNPGKKFTARGFPRHCYLPDNEKGRKILKLLIVAWERRLIFTIGTSNTTGESDTVVWNEIHHKTEFGSNLTGHGYPDPNYLDNVLAELMAQGVLEANLKD